MQNETLSLNPDPAADPARKELTEIVSRLDALEVNQKLRKEVLDGVVDFIDNKRKKYRDYWPIGFGLLTFSIAAVLGYQVWKANEIRQLYDQSSTQQKIHSKVSGDLGEALVLISLGYRDDSRKRFGSAVNKAEKAIGKLKSYSELLQYEKTRFTKVWPDLTGREFDQISTSLPAVRNALIAAYELKGRDSFFLMNSTNSEVAGRNLRRVEEVGERLQELDENNWAGPHFAGLALGRKADALKFGSPMRNAYRSQAKQLYLKAAELSPADGALDIMNLAENMLLEGEFGECVDLAGKYTQKDPEAPEEHILACQFMMAYAAYCRYPEDNQSLFESLKVASKKVIGYSFTNYDWTSYPELLKPESPLNKLADLAQKRRAKLVIEAIRERHVENKPAVEVSQAFPFLK